MFNVNDRIQSSVHGVRLTNGYAHTSNMLFYDISKGNELIFKFISGFLRTNLPNLNFPDRKKNIEKKT